MSHELLQEIYEKEKKTYDSFPTVTAKSVVSNYMSKRKLTQKTDKLFKSMNISSKKPKNSQEIELLSIKNKKTQSINPQNYVKASHKLRKLRNKNGSFSDNLQSRNELKQLETKLLNPFQTSYKSQFLNQGAIKWIPKRYGSNKNQRNFANNFYNTNPETTLEETDFLTNNDASDQIIKRFFEKDNANVSKDEKTNDEINKNNDGNNSNNLNNNKNNENTVKNNKKNDNSNNIHNNNIKNSNNDNDNNNEDDILHGSEQREICIFDENLKSNNTEEEIINIAPLSKTEYFKILNIGYHHLKNYKLPLEKLNEIIKENEEFFKHLAGAFLNYNKYFDKLM